MLSCSDFWSVWSFIFKVRAPSCGACQYCICVKEDVHGVNHELHQERVICVLKIKAWRRSRAVSIISRPPVALLFKNLERFVWKLSLSHLQQPVTLTDSWLIICSWTCSTVHLAPAVSLQLTHRLSVWMHGCIKLYRCHAPVFFI